MLSASPEAPTDKAYLVVSIAENRVWYKKGEEVLFTTRVATGSGKELVKGPGGEKWKFETPRGRLVVQAKEEEPHWVPPDWHFVEQARREGRDDHSTGGVAQRPTRFDIRGGQRCREKTRRADGILEATDGR